MKTFHFSDLLSVTTGKMLSTRGIEGIYDILNFMTNDNLSTHQLSRAMRECKPILHEQFSHLFPGTDKMEKLLLELDQGLGGLDTRTSATEREDLVGDWLNNVQTVFGLPDYIGIMRPMAENDHKHIDPVEELETMVGKDRIIIVKL